MTGNSRRSEESPRVLNRQKMMQIDPCLSLCLAQKEAVETSDNSVQVCTSSSLSFLYMYMYESPTRIPQGIPQSSQLKPEQRECERQRRDRREIRMERAALQRAPFSKRSPEDFGVNGIVNISIESLARRATYPLL